MTRRPTGLRQPTEGTAAPGDHRWTGRLLDWYRRHQRTLPWRSEPTPYRVWISEIMLQQTQVATATPYFDRFLKRLPDVRALAAADLETVLKLWEGLGYYSRARNLHKAARFVVETRNGEIPGDFDSLQTLPGIGPYTAAAIASIAFNQPVPVVDGNVLRVFCRFWKIDDDLRTGRPAQLIFDRLQPALGGHKPGDFNQALMELGALVCSPRNPDCGACPLQKECQARLEGDPERYPVKQAKAAVPHYHIAVGLIRNAKGEILVARRPEEKMLGGLWEFPGGKAEPDETPEQTARREILEETGLAVRFDQPLPAIRHAYSHFKITLHPFLCTKTGGRLNMEQGQPARWVRPEALQELPMPQANRKLLEHALPLLAATPSSRT